MKKHGSLFALTLAAFLAAGNCNAQWTQSALPVTNQITDILSYGNVWYVATSNNGIQSTQNFTDWTSSSSGIGTTDIRRIISSIEGTSIVLYASTANGIYRSTMLGYNWMAANNGLTSLNAGALFSDGTILLVSTANGVFRSENFGQSWSPVSVGASSQTVRCFLKNGTDILAGLANTGNYLYRSTDNGLTWLPYGSGMYEVNLLAKLGDELFAASGTLMYHSTDNGLNWSPASSGLVPGMYINDLVTQGNHLYVATIAGGYVQHTDSSSFTMITSGMPQGGYLINSVGVNSAHVVFGVVSNGLWYADPGVVTATRNPKMTGFHLFPNPANDRLNVSGGRCHGAMCEIRVWDICGKKVMDVFRGEFPPEGIEINVGDLPPGIYFLRIGNGQSVQVEKLIKQ